MAANADIYVGQRRSYAGALCTVRFHGPLHNTKGDWLGVEWDDPSRGKHSGEHEGRQIFRCLSSSPTAASFVRPSRKPDQERTLLEAIKFKYAPTTSRAGRSGDPANAESRIEISGKVVEEVGFELIQKQQSVLADLKIVLVDELVLSGVSPRHAARQDIKQAQLLVEETCPNIVELDVGWNSIERWQDVADMCSPLKKLKILKASGLRLLEYTADLHEDGDDPFRHVEELQLNECLLVPSQVVDILIPRGRYGFPSLTTLSLSLNELDSSKNDWTTQGWQCPSVTTLVLDNNKFTDLSMLPTLLSLFPNTATLSLQSNAVSKLGLEASESIYFPKLETLNLADNKITGYSFIDALPRIFPNLTSLRVSRNPLFVQTEQDEASDLSTTHSSTPSSHHRQARTTTTSDSTGYYLTLARIPHLKILNYTAVSPRDREEGEIYYLSVVEKELKALLGNESTTNRDEQISLARQRHPLYTTLCAKYDRDNMFDRYARARQPQHTPSTTRGGATTTYAPGTLGSRLVDVEFYIRSGPNSDSIATPSPFHRALPTTISVYRVKSLVAHHLGLPALGFRLVHESREYDPVAPISSSRNTGDAGPAGWAGWGDWDVDGDAESHAEKTTPAAGEDDEDGREKQPDPDPDTGPSPSPKYITRGGHRFKKRETEILDGMRAWGDFLDLDDASASAPWASEEEEKEDARFAGKARESGVRVRVEVI